MRERGAWAELMTPPQGWSSLSYLFKNAHTRMCAYIYRLNAQQANNEETVHHLNDLSVYKICWITSEVKDLSVKQLNRVRIRAGTNNLFFQLINLQTSNSWKFCHHSVIVPTLYGYLSSIKLENEKQPREIKIKVVHTTQALTFCVYWIWQLCVRNRLKNKKINIHWKSTL